MHDHARRPRPTLTLALCLTLTALFSATSHAQQREARLLRFPDIHRDVVVFVYGGDVWRGPSAGGEARRLTSHDGQELFPKISPDGRWVAYSAEYSGSRQVWVVPIEGGRPRQLTFYTDVGAMPPRGGWDYWILDWTPDGKILVRMNRTPWGERMGRYYLVDPAGGLETPLPLPEGGGASLSPDGKRLAYTPISREFRTWKRTRGGRAQDIWIYDLQAERSERLTDQAGTDNFPMWSGNRVYFTSDRAHTLNLYCRDLDDGSVRQLTRFDDYDVLWPALGPQAIVFMNGGWLYRLDLVSERVSKIALRLGDDLPATVPHFKDVSGFVDAADLSPSGKRAVFAARGELFSVPAKDGPTRPLGASQGVRERAPAWSPDGRWIAYLSDRSGEYEIHVRSQDGKGEPRAVTRDNDVWLFQPLWSPDSKRLAVGDRDRRLRVIDVDSGKERVLDRGTQGDLDTYAWSPDGRWLVYEKTYPTRLPGLYAVPEDGGEPLQLGDGLSMNFSPVVSRDGKYLFFLSNRDYQLRFSDFEFNYLYDRATRVYVASLSPDVPALFPLQSDEEAPAKDDDAEKKTTEKEGKAENDDEQAEEKPATEIVADGFDARTVALPGLEPGDYASLSAGDGAVFYLTRETQGAAGPLQLFRYELKEQKAEKVLDNVSGYVLSADGEKILYRSNDTFGIVDAKPGQKPGTGKLDLSGLKVKLDPRAEWRQMFEEAWRIGRDWFYDPEMHGVDWKTLGQRYRELVPYIAQRGDLDFILGELVGELEAGHTYVMSGDQPRVERIRGGMLGCELQQTADGRFRISHIFDGENWDDASRSPLTEPGVDVDEGDYLLAIDGEELQAPDNPYRPLENKAGAQVVLTVNDKPTTKGAREVTVRPVGSELNLRYLDWVKSRMALVDRLSDHRIGYIHLPNTAGSGNRMLQKLFYSQADKEALIIDDRYNGGGFIPDRMIEYFSRRTLAYWARRDVESMRTPGFAHDGPKVMLINGYSSSGGDALPYFFKKNELGQLIGTRTWGGLIGLTGGPSLVDGGTVLYPTFRIYDTEGQWVIENEGVAPDIEVIDLPERIMAGADPSIEKAVQVLLDELSRQPVKRPAAPKAPDMRK